MTRAERQPRTRWPSPTELPRRVRAARAYAGLSIGELAADLGVGAKTIKRIEAGSRTVRPYELWGIAEICGVSREFFTEEELWTTPRGTRGCVLDRLDRIETAVTTIATELAAQRGTE